MEPEVQNFLFFKMFLSFLICYILEITFDSFLRLSSPFSYGFFLELFLYTINLGPSALKKIINWGHRNMP